MKDGFDALILHLSKKQDLTRFTRCLLPACLLLLLVFLPGCASQQKALTLTVAAASSLQDALDEAGTHFSQENPLTHVQFLYGGSGSLMRQIEQGAPVDAFIPAAPGNLATLQQKGLLEPDSWRDLFSNTLVAVVPKGQPMVSPFEKADLPSIRTIALGDASTVPAGQYAAEVFEWLDLTEIIRERAVYGKDVRTVLSWVESGDADIGIVYGSDAKQSEKVDIAAVAPPGSHSRIVYPSGIMKESKAKAAASDFLRYLGSAEMSPFFEQYGFTRPAATP